MCVCVRVHILQTPPPPPFTLYQTLQFESYKSSGKILLSQSFTRGLLEQLEHAHTSLSVMLKSPYVGPHREEAAQWSLKLTSIADVLQKWVAVQELWQSLESVFSNEGAMKVSARVIQETTYSKKGRWRQLSALYPQTFKL